MAGDWIPFEKATLTKREVLSLVRLLNITVDECLGKLLRFWCWVDSNSEDGAIQAVSLDSVDLLMGSPGFAAALVSVGWLTERSHGLLIPRFDRHMGKSSKKRLAEAEKKRRQRLRQSSDISGGQKGGQIGGQKRDSCSVLFCSVPPGERNSEGQKNQEAEVRPPVQTPYTRPQSDLPCDNPEKFTAAKRIAEIFQRLCPAHGRSLVEIIGRLNDGATEDELENAANAYGNWCKASKKSPQHRLSLRSFFAPGGEWERFRSGAPEVICDPGEESIAEKVQRIIRGK